MRPSNLAPMTRHFEARVHFPLAWESFSEKIRAALGNQEMKNSNAVLLELLDHQHGDF